MDLKHLLTNFFSQWSDGHLALAIGIYVICGCLIIVVALFSVRIAHLPPLCGRFFYGKGVLCSFVSLFFCVFFLIFFWREGGALYLEYTLKFSNEYSMNFLFGY